MTTKELELWKGEFGDQYTDRNSLSEKDILNRIYAWRMIFSSMNLVNTGAHGLTIPKTILEVGSGIGANLVAISDLYKMNNSPIETYAVEPNKKAKAILKEQNITNLKIIEKDIFSIQAEDASMDLAFTCGVLIHVNPEDTLRAMKEVYRVTRRTIICMEYFSPELREIKYRDKDKALWTNDYGSLWLNNFKLTCLSYGFFWKPITGMDNVTYWAFEKVN